MDWPTIRAAIDFGIEHGSDDLELSFIGGEPLLEWPNLRRAVQYAERRSLPKRLEYAFTTNGSLLTDRIAAFLNRYDIETRISFDGVRQAQDLRKKGSFDEMDRLLDRLRMKHPALFRRSVRIFITLVPDAVPFLADSVAYLLGKDVRDIVISPCLTPASGWQKDWLEELEDQFARIFELSLRHFGRCNRVPVAWLRKMKGDRSAGPLPGAMCRAVKGTDLLIDADGQTYGCALFTSSYQQYGSEFLASRMARLRMGDFRAPDFWQRYADYPAALRKTELFHHKEKKHSSYGACGECRYLRQCAICPVAIGYHPDNQDPHRVPDFLCAMNIAALRYRRRFPALPDPREILKRLLGAGKWRELLVDR